MSALQREKEALQLECVGLQKELRRRRVVAWLGLGVRVRVRDRVRVRVRDRGWVRARVSHLHAHAVRPLPRALLQCDGVRVRDRLRLRDRLKLRDRLRLRDSHLERDGAAVPHAVYHQARVHRLCAQLERGAVRVHGDAAYRRALEHETSWSGRGLGLGLGLG